MYFEVGVSSLAGALQVNLCDVKELDFKYSGQVFVKGQNTRLHINFNHPELVFIEFTINDTRLSKMSVSSVVEGFTDDEILIRVRKHGEIQDISEEKEVLLTRPLSIDLREIEELEFKSSGTVMTIGKNTRLLLGFRDDDFVFVKLSIMNTDLNRIRVSDVFDNSIFASIIDQRD